MNLAVNSLTGRVPEGPSSSPAGPSRIRLSGLGSPLILSRPRQNPGFRYQSVISGTGSSRDHSSAMLLGSDESDQASLASGVGFEYKWDGYRAVLHVGRGRWRLLSRRHSDYTARVPELNLSPPGSPPGAPSWTASWSP